MSDKRQDFIDWLMKQEGKPYTWPTAENNYSGKSLPNAKFQDCFDCSGLVTSGLNVVTNGGVDWRATHNCNKLFSVLEDTATPEPGDLVFYGAGRNMLSHVMVWCADGKVYGSSGGNHHTTSPEIARKSGARVRFHNSHLYRPDFVGFKKLPL